MKNSKITAGYVLLALAILILLPFGYLYLAPIIIKGPDVLRARRLNLSNAKDYYAILSSWITFFVGFMGLALGYVYYRHKLGVDTENAANEKKRKRLDDLISKLNAYDALVDDILHRRFENAVALRQLRSKISRSFEEIVIMLELSQKLLGLNDSDVRVILRVNSFVDKDRTIMQDEINALSDDVLSLVKETYIDLIQDARRVCFNNVC